MRPQDLLLGARDFFAVLIPGAVLLLIIPLPLDQSKLEGLSLFAFAVAAYLAGSLASAVGGIADYLIDPILKSARYRRSIFGRKLACREKAAEQLRDILLESHAGRTPVLESYSVKSFWWDRLRLGCPPALLELDRIEARQKLFRSLMAIFLFLMAWSWWPASPGQPPRVTSPLSPLAWAFLSLISALLYASGRAQFLQALYRLAAGYYALLATPPDSGETKKSQTVPAGALQPRPSAEA